MRLCAQTVMLELAAIALTAGVAEAAGILTVPPRSPSAAVLTPDWLPESRVVKRVIPSVGDFYISTSGSDRNPGTLDAPLATIQKAVTMASPGQVILVRAGTYRQKVRFTSGNSGAANRYITLAAYPGEKVVIDGKDIALPDLSALIKINANYVRVSGFTVQDVAGDNAQMGILVENGSHVIIDNNHTIRTASAGIGSWYSHYVMIRNNRVQDGRTTGSQECLSVNDGSNFEISYNTVWNTRAWPQKCEGIDVKNGAAFGRVVKNTAHDLPYECFYVDAYRAPTHDIDVYANVAYNCSMGIAMTAEVDGALANIRVFDNVIHDTFYIGIGFPAWKGSVNRGTISNVSIYNNTIDNSHAQYTVNPTGFYFDYPAASNIVVRNNIVLTSGAAFTFGRRVRNLLADHNLVSAPVLVSGNPKFEHPFLFQGDPGFVDRGAFNYRLTAKSAARDKAAPDPAPSFDFDGAIRPRGSANDLGAFEY